jgi:hypothetical protein
MGADLAREFRFGGAGAEEGQQSQEETSNGGHKMSAHGRRPSLRLAHAPLGRQVEGYCSLAPASGV